MPKPPPSFRFGSTVTLTDGSRHDVMGMDGDFVLVRNWRSATGTEKIPLGRVVVPTFERPAPPPDPPLPARVGALPAPWHRSIAALRFIRDSGGRLDDPGLVEHVEALRPLAAAGYLEAHDHPILHLTITDPGKAFIE